jgi:hypothetical protein
MRLAIAFLALLLCSCAAVPSARFDDPRGQADGGASGDGTFRAVAFHAGLRLLDEDEWEPLDDQPALGLEYVHQRRSSHVGLEVGITGSADEDDLTIPGLGTFDTEVALVEVYLGAHRSFLDSETLRPYIGGGATLLSGAIDSSASSTEDDQTVALYLRGGLGYLVADGVEIGGELRTVLGAELDFDGAEIDADYLQATAFVAFRL